MRPELIKTFMNACKTADAITSFPELTEEQYNQLFMHMSNVDVETTVRTINYAHRMIQFELKKQEAEKEG